MNLMTIKVGGAQLTAEKFEIAVSAYGDGIVYVALYPYNPHLKDFTYTNYVSIPTTLTHDWGEDSIFLGELAESTIIWNEEGRAQRHVLAVIAVADTVFNHCEDVRTKAKVAMSKYGNPYADENDKGSIAVLTRTIRDLRAYIEEMS